MRPAAVILLALMALGGGAAAQEPRQLPGGQLNLIPERAEAPERAEGTGPEPDVRAVSGQRDKMLMVGDPDRFQVPDTQILGPAGPVRYGKLVALRVKPLQQRPRGLYSVVYVWRLHPTPDDLIVLADNTQAMFGSGVDPATVSVELIACYLFLDKDKAGKPLVAQRVVVVQQDIQIGNGTPPPPPPPPDPGPAPPPGPPPAPDTPLGLTKAVLSWMPQVAQPDPAVKRAEAAALARSFRGIAVTTASMVDYTAPDGQVYKLDDPGKILKATTASNNAAIPQSVRQWRPWFVSLDGKLKELKAAGKLSVPADYVAAWNEIGAGLEAAGR